MARSSTWLRGRHNARSALRAFVLLAGAALFLAATFSSLDGAFAQSSKAATSKECAPIKDLVNADTLLVARFDFNRIDRDKLGDSLVALFRQALKIANYSQEDEAACVAEFRKTVEGLKQDVDSVGERFKKQYGVSQIYYVMQTTRGDGECFVVPIKGVDSTKVDALKALAQKYKLESAVYKKDYLLASKTPLKELGAFYKEFAPGVNARVEKYFGENSDKLFVASCGRLKIRPLFHAAENENANRYGRVRQYDPFANSPRPIKNLVEIVDASFVGGRAYVDAATLNARVELQFVNSVNAGSFRSELSDALEAFNQFYFRLLERSPSNAKTAAVAPGASLAEYSKETLETYRIYQWMREFYSGCWQTLLPEQNDETIVFEVSAQNELKKIGCNTLAVAYFASNSRAGYARFIAQTKAIAADDPNALNPFEPTDRKNKPQDDEAQDAPANPFEEFLNNQEEAATESAQDAEEAEAEEVVDEKSDAEEAEIADAPENEDAEKKEDGEKPSSDAANDESQAEEPEQNPFE